MRLKDVMSTQVQVVGPADLLDRARMLMHSHGIHHLVVLADHRVVGVLREDALESRYAEGATKVETAMDLPVVTGRPEMTVRQAATLLRGRAVGALPILDGQQLVGIVTVSDLLDLLVKQPETRSNAMRRSRSPKQRAAPTRSLPAL